MLARQLSPSERLSDEDRKNDKTYKEMTRRRVINMIQKMDKIYSFVQRHYNQLALPQKGTLSWEKNMDPRRTDSELVTEDDYYGLVSQEQREQPGEHTRRYPIRQRRYVRSHTRPIH